MSVPTHDKDPSEIKKSYSEAITRATRFLISSAIILFILIVIVGQELREYRAKQANFAKQIRTTLDEKKNEERTLQALHKDICKDLRTYLEGRSNKEAPTTAIVSFYPATESREKTGSNRDLSAADALMAHEYFHRARLDSDEWLIETQPSFDITFGQLVSGCSPSSARKKLVIKERPFPRRTGGVRTPTDVEALTRDEQKLAGLIDVLKQDVEKQKQESEKLKQEEADKAKSRIQNTETLINNMAAYRDAYRRVIDLMRDLLNLAKESKSLNAAKNSIPTPFGNFQIAPRIALLGLAYATLLAYLSFLSSVRKIRTLSDRHSLADGDPSQIPVPLWSPSSSNESPADLTNGWTKVASIVVHLIWLLTIAWLTFECVYTWNAPEALAFAYKPFWGYLLTVVLMAVVLVALWLFLPARLKSVFAVRGNPDTAPRLLSNRRVFIGFGAVAIVGILTLGARRLFGKSMPKLPRRELANFTAAPDGRMWIQNKRKKKIVHMQGVCDRHLPALHNRLQSFEGDKVVHSACHARIYEQLGILASRQMRRHISEWRTDPRGRDKLTEKGIEQGKLAIKHFKKAIALKPLSPHLYDRLRKVYGALECYDEIPKLLQETLKMLEHEAKLAKDAGNQKRQQSLRRMKQAVELRVEVTEKRRTKAAEWRAKTGTSNQLNNGQLCRSTSQ